MPKIEPKQVQRDLEQDRIWPVYWLYGRERMKSRELLKRIKSTVLGTDDDKISDFSISVFDGNEITGSRVVDAAQSLSLNGGVRLVIVKDAGSIKESDDLEALLSTNKPMSKKDLPYVCVFISDDLDGRRKLSKKLIDAAAVVSCEEIVDEEREAWISYLAKKRGLALEGPAILKLRSLDPWSLDIIDQELEKVFLALDTKDGTSVCIESEDIYCGSDEFFESFFTRQKQKLLQAVRHLADSPEEALPLLGLFAWNVRQFALFKSNSAKKLNPYAVQRFNRWTKNWSVEQLIELQSDLCEIDFGLKQTQKLPLGLWTNLILKCL